MAVLKNAGLLPAMIKKESKATRSDFGLPTLDFSDNVGHDGTGLGTVKGLPLNQDFDAPINVIDSYQKEVIGTVSGSQIQTEGTLVLGNRLVTSNFGHDIGLNDFVVIANMFAQNDYEYEEVITDGTITSTSLSGSTVSITLTDVGRCVAGSKVVISGRVVSAEDKTYSVKTVVGNVITITNADWDDSDDSGLVTSTLGIHKMKIENVNDCTKQELENSYTVYLPSKFPDKDVDCTTSQGEVYTGVVPKSLDIDFIAAEYTVDTFGKTKEAYGDKSPRFDSDYKTASVDGYMRKNFGTLQKWDGTEWVALETLTLSINVLMKATEDQKVYKAGELSRAIVDGVEITGTYECILLDNDVEDNISNSLYLQRDDIQSGGLFRLALENTSGESIYVTANLKFYGEETMKEAGGHKFKTDFQILRSVETPNVEFEIINRYQEDLETFL